MTLNGRIETDNGAEAIQRTSDEAHQAELERLGRFLTHSQASVAPLPEPTPAELTDVHNPLSVPQPRPESLLSAQPVHYPLVGQRVINWLHHS